MNKGCISVISGQIDDHCDDVPKAGYFRTRQETVVLQNGISMYSYLIATLTNSEQCKANSAGSLQPPCMVGNETSVPLSRKFCGIASMHASKVRQWKKRSAGCRFRLRRSRRRRQNWEYDDSCVFHGDADEGTWIWARLASACETLGLVTSRSFFITTYVDEDFTYIKK